MGVLIIFNDTKINRDIINCLNWKYSKIIIRVIN